jgi:hypothetical protein
MFDPFIVVSSAWISVLAFTIVTVLIGIGLGICISSTTLLIVAGIGFTLGFIAAYLLSRELLY